MFAATVDLPAAIVVCSGVVTALAALGAAVAIFRQAAIKASLSTIIEANAELRKANDDLRAELATEKEKRAVLEGRMSIFVDEFADRIVVAVMETWRRTHPTLGEGANT
jgi:regulator of replication initiation timing